MKKIFVLFLISMLVFSQGCCTIFSGSSQMISVYSKPEGANVELGSLQGRTPYQVKLPKGKDYAIRVSYEGETNSTPLEKKVDPVFWINFFTLGPGFLIDFATQDVYKYDPTEYHFDFTGK